MFTPFHNLPHIQGTRVSPAIPVTREARLSATVSITPYASIIINGTIVELVMYYRKDQRPNCNKIM